MFVNELTDPAAVRKAADEYRQLGQRAFLDHYGFGSSQRYWVVVDGRLHDAKAIVGAAFGYQHPGRGPLHPGQFNGGESETNPALVRLGFTVVNSRPSTVDEERTWRLAVAAHLEHQKNDRGHVKPSDLREWGAYGGGQGVWVDAKRTKEIDPDGIAVGVLHTGLHYADDLSDDGILYHYPNTNRPGKRDDSEVFAMKRAAELRIPVFVISDPNPKSSWRQVRLAWIEGWDDAGRIFSLNFDAAPPLKIQDHDDSDDEPFQKFGNSSRRKLGFIRQRPAQPGFKLKVIQRYGMRCPLSGVTVPEMLDAIHLIPDADDGASDPRNGLPMNAALHRAFDAGLFAINPTTFAVECRPGITPEDLGMKVTTLVDLPKKPHPEALLWRYEWWTLRSPGGSS